MNNLDKFKSLNKEYIHSIEHAGKLAAHLDKLVRIIGKNGEEASLHMRYQEASELLERMAKDLKERWEGVTTVGECNHAHH